MDPRTLLRTGVIGSAVTAICCFTPALVLLFAGLGLSAAIGWIDWIMLPALAMFLTTVAYALWLRRKQQ